MGQNTQLPQVRSTLLEYPGVVAVSYPTEDALLATQRQTLSGPLCLNFVASLAHVSISVCLGFALFLTLSLAVILCIRPYVWLSLRFCLCIWLYIRFSPPPPLKNTPITA